MLDTTLSDMDRYPLKLSDLVVMDLDKVMAPMNLTWASGPDQWLKDLPTVGFSGDRFYGPMWTSQQWTEYAGSIMTIDPSGRGKDETSYAVVKYLHGRLYLLDCGGFRAVTPKVSL